MALHTQLSRTVLATSVVTLIAAASGSAVAAAGSGSPKVAAPTSASSAFGYALVEPGCSTTVVAGQMNCFAVKLISVPAGTPGAHRYLRPFGGSATSRTVRTRHAPALTIGLGPAGGYTPDDLASVYGFNPAAKRASQTLGIVDWYDDVHIKSDLAAFDRTYKLRKESTRSFRVVNQKGKRSPLPSSKKGRSNSFETALDVETVRGVCHTCRILLVEANGGSNNQVGAAEDTAVRLGATEVTNSFGDIESSNSTRQRAAFNHPGVVITASTGDDGWFSWDQANVQNGRSSNQPNFPSTGAGVVSVGGTSLSIDQEGGRNGEIVWNENGQDDQVGGNGSTALQPGADGATGGGCSRTIKAPSWQSAFPGYSAAGCNGHRLAADVSADADPYYGGLDVYDTWEKGDHGWITAGGTSLASPIVAAMYALAGGSGGAAYPAFSVYNNAAAHAFDVTGGGASNGISSGNGLCGGDATLPCGTYVFDTYGGESHNPNALGAGNVDCSFPRNRNDVATAPTLSPECNAVPGYDGPSGVGTPMSDALFTSTSPTAAIHRPAVVRLHRSATFTASSTERLGGADITRLTFSWGDGHSSTGTSKTQSHTFTRNGTYRVTLTVRDSAGQTSVAHSTVVIGKPLGLHLFGPSSLPHGHAGTFHAKVTDHNTGGKVTSVRWSWGDGHKSKGATARHTWHGAGVYKIVITLKDSTGVVTKWDARQHVT